MFPCIEEPSSEIPRCIQKYYEMYLDKSYQKEMKSLFDVTFSTEDVTEENLVDALKSIFDLPTEESWTGSVEQHNRNIETVAEKLIEETGQTKIILYSLSKKDLSILREEYIVYSFRGIILNLESMQL